MTFDSKTIQAIIAYASIVMGVLTTQLQGVHLPVWGSAILGIFGILLHPDTSITVPTAVAPKPVLDLTPKPAAPVQGNLGAPVGSVVPAPAPAQSVNAALGVPTAVTATMPPAPPPV